MVRKDVKIGAAVLGVLLTVLIVYVLVVPGGDGAGNGAANGAGDAAQPAAEPVAANRTGGANQPAVLDGAARPGQPGGTTPIASNQNGTTPRDPFGPASADERWMLALNTGVVPDGRVTPTGAPGSANRPKTTPQQLGGNTPLSIPTTRPGSMRTHVVQPGESLARIAENVYGSQVYFKQIMAANPGIKPERLKPGMVINLPDAKEVKGAGNTDDDSPAPAIDARLEYRVQSGDSMHRIAQKLYGKTEMWMQIYELNKTKIGADPAKLKVGMILKLPTPPTQGSR